MFFFSKKVFIIAGCLISLLISPLAAETIKVATEEWEYCTNKDGTGLYFDILRAVYEPEGYELELIHVPYSRSTYLVESQRADLVIGIYPDELEKVIYPRWHFDNDDVSVVYRRGSGSWQNEESLRGKSVAYIRGYDYDDYFTVPFSVNEVNSRETGYALLENDRVDYFIDAGFEINTYKEGVSGFDSKFEVEHVKWLPLYFGFVDTPRGQQLADLYDARFKESLDSGKIKELFDEWEFDSFNF